MAIQVYSAGKANAKARIRAGDISSASWSFSASDGNKLLGGKDGTNWTKYAKWHLGEDTSATKKTKARHKYPFGKGGLVYLSALRAIRTRSAQAGAATIFTAAGELLDSAKKKVEKRSYLDDFEVNNVADVITFVRALRKSIE